MILLWLHRWTRKSLRARVTFVATVVLAVGLVVGTATMARLFVAERVAAVDKQVRATGTTIADLVSGGSLPTPLPVPAGSAILAQVVDPTGTVLSSSSAQESVFPVVPRTQSMIGAPEKTSTLTSGGATLRVDVRTVSYHGSPVLLIVAVPFADTAQTLNAFHRLVFTGVPIVLLAAALAIWFAVGSSLRPVDELRAAADAVEASVAREPPRLDVPVSAVELRRLGETLNRMLERVHGAGEQQRAFVADAAHELRSPLASILTQLEVALATPTTAEEWPQIAAGVHADAERLRLIADDLLLLARLDAGARAPYTAVDLSDLLGLDQPPLVVQGDRQALRRLFDNLVTNAEKYAGAVQVAAVADGDVVVVTVDDDGPGVPEADRERVFERFVRLDTARSRDAGGTGLGLPIARAVARAHGGDVHLDASPLGGLRATVRLPQATD